MRDNFSRVALSEESTTLPEALINSFASNNLGLTFQASFAKYLTIVLFILLMSVTNVEQVFAQDPFVPKYDAFKRSERCFTITSDMNDEFGSVWWADKMDLSQDTVFNFVLYMGSKDNTGADGIAFVMHKDPRDTITAPGEEVIIGTTSKGDLSAAAGDDGDGLGYAYKIGNFDNNTIPGPYPEPNIENHKIQPSVAIEFDTWRSNEVHDGSGGLDGNGINQPTSPYLGWDHTSVVYNGNLYSGQQLISDGVGYMDRILPLKPSYAFGTANNADGSPYHNIENDECHTYQVRWTVNGDNTQNLELWVDPDNSGSFVLIMEHIDDMISNVFAGDASNVRCGFTGSTGGARNEQTICLSGENLVPVATDDYVLAEPNTVNVIDILANDSDPDNDELEMPLVLEGPKNGIAQRVDSSGFIHLQYSPNPDFTGKDSLSYMIADMNSTKCYAKTDTAFVFIQVGREMISLIATDVTNCDPANGTIQVLPAGDTTDYTYELYSGTSAIVENLIAASSSSYFTDLEAGDYTAVAIDIRSSIASYAVTTSIYVDTSPPNTVVLMESPDFSCAGGDPTGVLSATIVGASDGDTDFNNFTLSWTSVATGLPTDTDNGGGLYADKAINLAAGDYMLEVTDIAGPDIGCTNVALVSVISEIRDIAVTASSTDQLTCLPDGTIQLDRITEDGDPISSPFDGWNISLFDTLMVDISALHPQVGIADDPFINLSAGTYYIQVQDDLTKCYSSYQGLSIDNVSTDPIIDVTMERPDYACTGGLPTGILNASMVGGSDGDTDFNNYTLSWKETATGLGTLTDNGGGLYADKAVELAAGEYTLEVTDNAGLDAGCVTTMNFTVSSDMHDVLIEASATDQQTCQSDGTIQLDGITEDGIPVATPYTGWHLYLLDSSSTDITLDHPQTGFDGDPFADLPAGTYYLQVMDDSTMCYSDLYQVEVLDNSSTPIVSVTMENPDYACPGGLPTGILSASISGGTDSDADFNNFTITWKETATGLGTVIDNGGGLYADKAIELAAGEYTVVVTDDVGQDAGCVTTMNYTVNSVMHDIEITTSSSDQQTCLADGTIQLDLIVKDGVPVPSPQVGWELYLLDALSTDITPVSQTGLAGDPFTDVPAGNYYIQVKDNSTRCYSDFYEVEVLDNSSAPIVSISMENPDYACSGGFPTGILGASILGGTDSDADFNNFTITWKETATGLGTVTDDGGGFYADKAVELAAGEYTVEVTDNVGMDAGCVTTMNYTVGSAQHDIEITASSTDQQTCLADGTIQLDLIIKDGVPVPSPHVGWDLYLLDALSADITPISQTGFAGDPFTDVLAGNYYVQVLDNSTQCYTEPQLVSVQDVSALPTATFIMQDQTSCDEANLTGGVTAIPTVGASTDYLFEWFQGSLSGMSIGNDNAVLTELDSGVYALRMTHKLNQCSNVFYPRVEAQLNMPLVTVTSEPTGESGEDGALYALADGLSSGYRFAWFSIDLSTALQENGANLIGVLAGEYSVQARNNDSKCASKMISVVVEDGTKPEISCAPNKAVMLGANETTYMVLGTELDPIAASDNYRVESLTNDFNGSSSLSSADIPLGTNTITWVIVDEAGNSASCTIHVDVSITTGIEENVFNELSIYPNPTADIVTIESPQNDLQYLRLTDLAGQVLIEQSNFVQSITLDLSSFTSGVYVLSIQSGDRWYNQKIDKK